MAGWLNKFFGKPAPREYADFQSLEVDFHSHLIPGIDDGASTIEDSIALIRGLHQLGYRKLITTPHVMSDYYKNTPEIILGGLEKVREAVRSEGLDVELEAAAEYYLDSELEHMIQREPLLTFGDNHVLVELSFMQPPHHFEETVFKLISAGYKPILAHPERYSYYYRDISVFEEMKDRGWLLQLNINSLTGHYSPQTRKVAEQMLERGYIDFLGSDCHHLNHIELMHKALDNPALQKALGSGNIRNPLLR
ncbi:MAG: histidinol phosphatase [Flavobacteriales bacterium]|nr:histidinol phosphatase [Flavobacteriales bacterium]